MPTTDATDRRDELALAATLLAPLQPIEADAEQARGNAQQGIALAVLAQVDAEGLRASIGEAALRIECAAQRARKAFAIRLAAIAAKGSPSTMRQKIRSERPRRLNARISWSTQLDFAAAGDPITIRADDAVAPR